MKLTKIISLLLVLTMALTMLASCNLEDVLAGIMGSITTQPTTPTVPSSSTSTTDKGEDDPEDDKDAWDEAYEIITIAEAIEIAKQAGQDPTTERYYIRGTIETISNPTYGEMTISDETGSIYVYGTYSHDGALKFPEIDETPVKGDEVLLHCTLSTHNGTPQVKNARLIDFISVEVPPSVNPDDYTEMAIVDARDAAVGTLIKVTGVVAQITYANGMKPSGVYLVDGTNSIYVYDGDIASQVKIGNKITVLGEKDMWILEKEQNAAQQFGYKGCCQLSSAVLFDNDKATNEIDFEWCEEKSIKDILETPVSENITTSVYKTTALVTKVDEGTGFVNYYFNDLDGKTGTYTYTQCNGADFGWLDEFDGKICTVYLSVINAKSTDTGCIWRVLPITVIDEGFVFDISKAPEHAVKYYGVGQFLSTYTSNPSLELIPSVSSELLGFENITLSYSSDNEEVAYFTTANGVTVFHCGEKGEANITVTATAEDNTSYSQTIKVTVKESESYDYISVDDAVKAEINDIVIVKGIVGPSIANKPSGFYLIDETGVIAVLLNTVDELKALEIGQEIVITGTRDRFHNNNGTHAGQTCITSASVLVNNYGEHKYSTESFVTGITPEEFYDLDKSVDYSTTVFVFEATILAQNSGYSVNYSLKGTDASKAVNLYSGSPAQYAWLEQFIGQKVTVEVAACNWNNKSYWRGCVLSVTTEDGQVFNEYNFKAE